MPGPDLALSAYLQLAVVSHQKGQWLPRNKFLILAGNAACHAGLLSIAAECRALVVTNSPGHMLGHYDSYPEALQDADFQTFLKQLSKFCTLERAEHLLAELGKSLTPATPESASQLVQAME